MVGELSSVEFRRIGSCRVHIFLRIADVPGRDPHSAQRTRPTVDATAAASSIAGVSDENIIVLPQFHQGLGIFGSRQTELVVCLSKVLLPCDEHNGETSCNSSTVCRCDPYAPPRGDAFVCGHFLSTLWCGKRLQIYTFINTAYDMMLNFQRISRVLLFYDSTQREYRTVVGPRARAVSPWLNWR